MKYVIVTEKKWHISLFETIKSDGTNEWILIDKRENFSEGLLDKLNPDKIFIPHWSYIIPSNIYEKYECIVFHMTDLPYGRGGSPLQNLIVRGHDRTKISALRVEKGVDCGPIYLKKELILFGTAEEIFIRANQIIFKMIREIILCRLVPTEQEGIVTSFKRRKPEESDINELTDISKLHDYIRMLDAEGYPKAFIENDSFKFEFSRASLKASGEIVADVKIRIK